MKKILSLCIAALLIAACSNKEKLDRETALKLIEDSKTYPKVVGYNIFVSDPAYAKRVLDAGLEESGFVIVQRTRKLNEVGKPIISFTAKADPYLLTQSTADNEDNIQRVKFAEEVIEQITGIRILEGGTQAIAEIKTTFKNITPFSKLSNSNFAKEKIREAEFSFYDDGWRLVSN